MKIFKIIFVKWNQENCKKLILDRFSPKMGTFYDVARNFDNNREQAYFLTFEAFHFFKEACTKGFFHSFVHN